MMLFRRSVAALALAVTLPAFCADLSIMPVAVQLDAQHDRSTVRVTNQGKEAVILQADAIGWAREAGVDRDTTTSDLIVNPPVFTVAPGQTQIVRVGMRRDSASETESTYRMVLREVPSANTGSETLQGQVRVLVAVRVPVYVAPSVVRRQGALGRALRRVRPARRGGHEQRQRPLQGRLVAPGLRGRVGDAARRRSAVRRHAGRGAQLRPSGADQPAGDKPLTLEVQTDNGMQYVPIEIAQK